MKRGIVICEGQTEREFCTYVLAPYLIQYNVIIQTPVIKRSMGGIVKWSYLKKEIENHLMSSNVFVTTLIDYYGLYEKFNFPDWSNAEVIEDKVKRMETLELAMFNDVNSEIRHRYIPYLQLHEFEGLLFNDIKFFYEQIPADELVGVEELRNVFREYSNPELINNFKETSPSSRLKRIIKGYNKVVYGYYLASAIGIDNIRLKAPRFNQWVDRIIAI